MVLSPGPLNLSSLWQICPPTAGQVVRAPRSPGSRLAGSQDVPSRPTVRLLGLSLRAASPCPHLHLRRSGEKAFAARTTLLIGHPYDSLLICFSNGKTLLRASKVKLYDKVYFEKSQVQTQPPSVTILASPWPFQSTLCSCNHAFSLVSPFVQQEKVIYHICTHVWEVCVRE